MTEYHHQNNSQNDEQRPDDIDFCYFLFQQARREDCVPDQVHGGQCRDDGLGCKRHGRHHDECPRYVAGKPQYDLESAFLFRWQAFVHFVGQLLHDQPEAADKAAQGRNKDTEEEPLRVSLSFCRRHISTAPSSRAGIRTVCCI